MKWDYDLTDIRQDFLYVADQFRAVYSRYSPENGGEDRTYDLAHTATRFARRHGLIDQSFDLVGVTNAVYRLLRDLMGTQSGNPAPPDSKTQVDEAAGELVLESIVSPHGDWRAVRWNTVKAAVQEADSWEFAVIRKWARDILDGILYLASAIDAKTATDRHPILVSEDGSAHIDVEPATSVVCKVSGSPRSQRTYDDEDEEGNELGEDISTVQGRLDYYWGRGPGLLFHPARGTALWVLKPILRYITPWKLARCLRYFPALLAVKLAAFHELVRPLSAEQRVDYQLQWETVERAKGESIGSYAEGLIWAPAPPRWDNPLK
jgi:hypothetical protein